MPVQVTADRFETAPAGPVPREINLQTRFDVTEPIVRDGLAKVEQLADETRKRWEKRVDKEGTDAYKCPFCREHFTGKTLKAAEKSAQQHLKSTHPAQLQQAKLLKWPKAAYTPQKIKLSPPPTLEDYVGPERAKIMEAARAVTQPRPGYATQPTGLRTRPEVVINMPEGQAREAVVKLNDKSLIAASRLAWQRGKQMLLRTCRKELAKRQLKVNF